MEDIDLAGRLQSLDARIEEQQAARVRLSRAWSMLFIGTGIVVTLLSFLLGGPGAAIVIAYWVGGSIALVALRRIVLEPRLDERFPLSRQPAHRREKVAAS